MEFENFSTFNDSSNDFSCLNDDLMKYAKGKYALKLYEYSYGIILNSELIRFLNDANIRWILRKSIHSVILVDNSDAVYSCGMFDTQGGIYIDFGTLKEIIA